MPSAMPAIKAVTTRGKRIPVSYTHLDVYKRQEQEALAYLSEELEVTSAEEALQGANDIIAELISDDASIRKRLRVVTMEPVSYTHLTMRVFISFKPDTEICFNTAGSSSFG